MRQIEGAAERPVRTRPTGSTANRQRRAIYGGPYTTGVNDSRIELWLEGTWL